MNMLPGLRLGALERRLGGTLILSRPLFKEQSDQSKSGTNWDYDTLKPQTICKGAGPLTKVKNQRAECCEEGVCRSH